MTQPSAAARSAKTAPTWVPGHQGSPHAKLLRAGLPSLGRGQGPVAMPRGGWTWRVGCCRRRQGRLSPAQGAPGTPASGCGRQHRPWGRGGGTGRGRGMRPAGCQRRAPPDAPSWGCRSSPAWGVGGGEWGRGGLRGVPPPPLPSPQPHTTRVPLPGDPDVPGKDLPGAACGEAGRR